MKNLKKVISSVAALAIVASSASAFAVTFPDVDSSASYANAVNALVGLGIVNGDDNGLFNPDNQVTRAEFTKMAVGALGEASAAEAQTTSQFADAANTTQHWAAGYIAQGVSDGFINGYDETTFGPDDQVTYAQACKMLVAAIGYTTYAENQGGWPAGYVAQANTLGITAGVSATNDTNLTRAQVATLIYNAMDVPLCVIDSWESSINYLTGEVVQTPVLKKLDGFSKSAGDYQTLLTDRHNAYKVKGRVTVTSKGGNSEVEKDEVKYSVEVSDNFDDAEYTSKVTPAVEVMKYGETKAADMLYEYSEALVQKDEDSDEYTILAITPYGSSKTVEIAAKDVADDDKVISTNYAANGKLPVYKSATSSSTTKYDLKKKDQGTTIYVNGVEFGTLKADGTGLTDAAFDQAINDYILENPTGKVTLVDVTNAASTTTDGMYEYIMIDYYVAATVDYTASSSTYNRIYFKTAQNQASGLKYDPENKDLDLTITKDGQEIGFEDLKEFDVLSIAYDVVNNPGRDIDELDYYNIIVSNNTVSGTVTSKDPTDLTVRISGSDYDINDKIFTIDDFELSTDYTIYLDAFGYVAYIDEGTSDKNYGVIVAMYHSSGNDYSTVRMITSDAQVVAYECKDNNEAKKFYEYATGGTYVDAKTSTFTKSSNAAKIKAGATACEYQLSSGKIKFKSGLGAVNGGSSNATDEIEYRASATKLGSYNLAEGTTKIIDMDSYMKDTNSGSTVSTLSVSDFEDEATYVAYGYDKNNDGYVRFLVVYGGTSSIRPDSTIAVVKKNVGTTDVDGTKCTELTVGRAGSDEVSVLVDGEINIAEGTVIAYTVGSEGYVEDGDLYTLYTPDSSYETLLANTVAKTDFSTALNSDVVTSVTDKGTKYAITYTDSQKDNVADRSKDAYAYVGVVYKKSSSSFELITSQTAGKSSTNATSFTIDSNTNVYTFDYNEKANKGTRLTATNSGTQNTSIFNAAMDSNKDYITWADVQSNEMTPQIAFVKEVDGDVTDVVFFIK